MSIFLCLYLAFYDVPNASVVLKGIGVNCYPFYLDAETAIFTYPSLVTRYDKYISVSKFDRIPDWARHDFRTFVRSTIHYPSWTAINIEGYYHENYWNKHSEITWTQSLGYKRYGFVYSIGYRDFPDEFEYEQLLATCKTSFMAFDEKLFLNIGVSYGKATPAYGEEHWILGPIIEVRYSIVPFTMYLSSRHPESFLEFDSLPVFHVNYTIEGFKYQFIPFEAGIALVQTFHQSGTMIIGLRIKLRYIQQSTEFGTTTMSPENYMFVSGFDYNITQNISLRAGFVLDYFIDNHRTREIKYNPSMGASFRLDDKFVFDFATKSLSTPLNYDVAVRWFF